MLRNGALCGLMVAALLLSACNNSSDDDASDRTQGVVLADASQATAAGGWVALQASLNAMEPGTYDELQGPPAVTVAGTTDSGTVTIDFGAGTTINGTEFAGVVTASYGRITSSTATVTVNMNNLEVTGGYGTADVSGSVTIDVTLFASSAEGTITGDVTLVRDSRTIQVRDIDIDYNLDATTGTVLIPNGDAQIEDSVWGTWDVDITGLLAQVVSVPRTIDNGEIELDRVDFPQVTVTLDFDSPNAGEVTVDPGGLTTSFSF